MLKPNEHIPQPPETSDSSRLQPPNPSAASQRLCAEGGCIPAGGGTHHQLQGPGTVSDINDHMQVCSPSSPVRLAKSDILAASALVRGAAERSNVRLGKLLVTWRRPS